MFLLRNKKSLNYPYYSLLPGALNIIPVENIVPILTLTINMTEYFLIILYLCYLHGSTCVPADHGSVRTNVFNLD